MRVSDGILTVEIGDSESERCYVTNNNIVVGLSSCGYLGPWVFKHIVLIVDVLEFERRVTAEASSSCSFIMTT